MQTDIQFIKAEVEGVIGRVSLWQPIVRRLVADNQPQLSTDVAQLLEYLKFFRSNLGD